MRHELSLVALPCDCMTLWRCAGGSTTGAQPLQSIEVYDPSTRAWLVSTANLGQPVTQVGCAALNNTHVVVAGGALLPGLAC